MRFFRSGTRYLILLFFFAFFLSFLASWFFLKKIRKMEVQETQKFMLHQASLLQDFDQDGMRKSRWRGIKKVFLRQGMRALILDGEGKIILDSMSSEKKDEEFLNSPEMIEARNEGEGFAQRFSSIFQQDVIAAVLLSNKEGGGFIRLSLPVSSIDRKVLKMQKKIEFAQLVFFLLFVFVSLLCFFSWQRPLFFLIGQAEKMSEGDFSSEVSLPEENVHHRLASALNRISKVSKNRLEIVGMDRNKLLTILSGMDEGVVAVDLNERILHLNQAARKILHLPSVPVGESSIWEFIRVRGVCEAISRCIQNGELTRGEIKILHEGKERVLRMLVSQLRNSESQPVGALAVLHDVTLIRQHEAIRKDFAANVSHELKTPITAIRGLVETMMEDKKMKFEVRDGFMKRLQDQVFRMGSLVSDLLSLSKLESDDVSFEFSPLDLRLLLEQTFSSCHEIANQKGITLSCRVPEKPVMIQGDEETLSQMAGNLIDNAIRYSEEKNSVFVRLIISGNRAVIEVKDNGPGIEPIHLDRIFERFYRVDKARSRALGGTGLGLSIVKHICLAHEGSISVESEPGLGTTFRASFPLS